MLVRSCSACVNGVTVAVSQRCGLPQSVPASLAAVPSCGAPVLCCFGWGLGGVPAAVRGLGAFPRQCSFPRSCAGVRGDALVSQLALS